MVGYFVTLIAGLVLITLLQKHRADAEGRADPFKGRSKFRMVNVLRWGNYRPSAHRLLLALYAVAILNIAVILLPMFDF